ncbi:MAG: dUTP diphosphatase [Desulfatibacillaceae bacterium]
MSEFPDNPTIRVKRLFPGRDADIPLPRYMTPHSAGMDVCAAVEQDIVLEPGDIVLIPTGLAMAIPPGFEVQVRPRSGLAVKHGISLANSPGTIDADYRGEVSIALVNLGGKPYTVHRGDRVAQLIVGRAYTARVVETDDIDDTPRGHGGFGHTGRR